MPAPPTTARYNRLRQTTPALVLFFCSGAAALGYQFAWARLLTPGLGHETPAVLAVVGAFLGGMALGAWRLDRPAAVHPRPWIFYARLEILIGAWGLLTLLLIPWLNQMLPAWIGAQYQPWRQWALSLIIPFFALLPATLAMGATFAAMERFLASLAPANGPCVGTVYAANTLGAVAGTLATTFWMVPKLGLLTTMLVLAAINLSVGVLAWRWRPGTIAAPASAPERAGNDQAPARGLPPMRLHLTLFLTGLLGIGFEVVGVRILSQVLENTVYTYAALLAVYLLGTGCGAALYQRVLRRRLAERGLTVLLLALSTACALAVVTWAKGEPVYRALRSWLGDAWGAVLLAEISTAALGFALPTLCMGAVFSHLVQSAKRLQGGVGRAVAVNTLGGALAGALFGVVLLPGLGARWTVLVIAWGYLCLLPALSGWRWAWAAVPIAIGLLGPAHLRIVEIPPGGRLAAYRDGTLAAVAVVEGSGGEPTLRVNNRFQMGGTAAAKAEYRQAHLPLLLHRAPRRALFLGLGTGITLGGAALHPGLTSEGVELLPEVVALLPHFEPENQGIQRLPHTRVIIADARRYVRATTSSYDVIVADLFHPALDGAGSLYTREHFRAIRQRLTHGGLFCQWLRLDQFDEPMLRVVIRTFLEVFPEAEAWLLWFNVDAPVLGLFGAQSRFNYASDWLEQKLAQGALPKAVTELGLTDSVRFFGHALAGPHALRDYAGAGPLNTDLHAIVTFGAPAFSFRQNVHPHQLLFSLLTAFSDAPAAERAPPSWPAALDDRLHRYVRARNVYLEGLAAEATGRPEQAIDACVESARLSSDFTLGYARCLSLASLTARAEPEKARRLLERLRDARPDNPVAADFLKRLFPTPPEPSP